MRPLELTEGAVLGGGAFSRVSIVTGVTPYNPMSCILSGHSILLPLQAVLSSGLKHVPIEFHNKSHF